MDANNAVIEKLKKKITKLNDQQHPLKVDTNALIEKKILKKKEKKRKN